MSIQKKDVPIFILCGGLGTRMKEETEFKPKPMVEIGGEPILIHIMRYYANFGFNNFVLCLGFKAEYVKNYFLNRKYLKNDFLIKDENNIEVLGDDKKSGWTIRLFDTGLNSMTGSRIAKAFDKYEMEFEHFGVTYGDGICDVNLDESFKFHLKHRLIGTITGVNPVSRFGQIEADEDLVMKFVEKPKLKNQWINGGYFFFRSEFRSYLKDTISCVLEQAPLMNLSKKSELKVHKHSGYWQCMDTQRDKEELEKSFDDGEFNWLIEKL
jgi:glucose-1-phosphate cytidylyltransferase